MRSAFLCLVLATVACARPALTETPAVREALMLRAEVERMAVVAEREFQIALALNAAWAMDEALRCRGVEGR